MRPSLVLEFICTLYSLTGAFGLEPSRSPQKYYSKFENSNLSIPEPSPHSLAPGQRQAVLGGLIQNYLSTMMDLEVITWLAHGTLLGWYWGQKIMPWDTDLDVHVRNLTFLASYYVQHDRLPI